MSNRFEHGGNLHHLPKNSLLPLLDFSANINPLGLPGSVRRTIMADVEGIIHYPDAEAHAIKEAVSQYYRVPQNSIVMGNGAVEILYLLCHHLRPRRVLIPAPSFGEYERAALASGAAIRYHFLSAEDDFALDSEALIAELSDCDMVFLGNPNNPTGNLLRLEELRNILAAAKQQNIFVVIDESFMDFIDDAARYSAKSLLTDSDHLLVLHSLTKFYAIPGLRLGFALTGEKLAQSLHWGKDPWNVNSLAQAAGIAALADTSYQEESRRFLKAEIVSFIKNMICFTKIKLFCPTVNFALADIGKTGFDSAALKAACLNEGILIRDCANYPGLSGDYVRFAVKATAENERLYRTLAKILGGG